jgi:membrane protein implicated in regulation of membrane protease activity
MIVELITDLGPWSWIILSAVLMGLEILAPGTFLIWFGLAAALVGAISFALDLSWQSQLIAFGLLSLASVFGGRAVYKNKKNNDDPLHSHLNERASAMIGREFILQDNLASGYGRQALGETTWAVKGPDLPSGTKVKVVSVESSVLIIEAVE